MRALSQHMNERNEKLSSETAKKDKAKALATTRKKNAKSESEWIRITATATRLNSLKYYTDSSFNCFSF